MRCPIMRHQSASLYAQDNLASQSCRKTTKTVLKRLARAPAGPLATTATISFSPRAAVTITPLLALLTPSISVVASPLSAAAQWQK
mmetsp:Transcript_11889/g.26026  ORF Transcript_11889/g.26026 Transcript_11889/m.26026 type:complete len:86 (-) Transcript_11889:1330-1587(-)